jgi:hypothetical protein
VVKRHNLSELKAYATLKKFGKHGIKGLT